MAFPYLEAVLGFMILMYIFETYLDLRQHAAHKLTTLPKPLLGVVSKEKFDKARAYSLDKSYFHFVHEAFTILMDSMILFFGVLPWFWKRSGDVVLYMGFNAENEILHTLAFLGGVMIWSQITDLPFSLYSTFVIEARHGFNKVLTFLQFGGYTLVRNSKDLFQSFGFETQPVLIGLIIFQHTVIPLQHLVSFGLNLVSRAFEFQMIEGAPLFHPKSVEDVTKMICLEGIRPPIKIKSKRYPPNLKDNWHSTSWNCSFCQHSLSLMMLSSNAMRKKGLENSKQNRGYFTLNNNSRLGLCIAHDDCEYGSGLV